MRKLIKCMTLFLPMYLKRKVLNRYFHYQIAPSARIGFSWFYPKKLIMGNNSSIGHFNVAIHLDVVELGENTIIGRKNWITGFETKTKTPHFNHQPLRKAILKIGRESAITKDHHIDCTNEIIIGDFVTIAGYQSQFLTHSIDIYQNRQDSHPIYIGNYCFVGSNVLVLGGARLPDHSVLGAKSLLNKPYVDNWQLYAGVPARPVCAIDKNAAYFHRSRGYVD